MTGHGTCYCTARKAWAAGPRSSLAAAAARRWGRRRRGRTELCFSVFFGTHGGNCERQMWMSEDARVRAVSCRLAAESAMRGSRTGSLTHGADKVR